MAVTNRVICCQHLGHFLIELSLCQMKLVVRLHDLASRLRSNNTLSGDFYEIRHRDSKLTMANESSPGIGNGGGIKLSPPPSVVFFLNFACMQEQRLRACFFELESSIPIHM